MKTAKEMNMKTATQLQEGQNLTVYQINGDFVLLVDG